MEIKRYFGEHVDSIKWKFGIRHIIDILNEFDSITTQLQIGLVCACVCVCLQI